MVIAGSSRVWFSAHDANGGGGIFREGIVEERQVAAAPVGKRVLGQ